MFIIGDKFWLLFIESTTRFNRVCLVTEITQWQYKFYALHFLCYSATLIAICVTERVTRFQEKDKKYRNESNIIAHTTRIYLIHPLYAMCCAGVSCRNEKQLGTITIIKIWFRFPSIVFSVNFVIKFPYFFLWWYSDL